VNHFESKEAMAGYFRENPDLTDLRVENCPFLTSWAELPCILTKLSLYNCPGLTSLPVLPCTLTDLWVNHCPGLTSRALKVGQLTIKAG